MRENQYFFSFLNKEETGIKGKMLFMPIRIKVSGKMHGPELGDTIYLLGKDVILNRLDRK